jgi:hypothetical protein
MPEPGDRDSAWFVPKRFGFGATPVTLQGWLSVIGFAVLVLAILRLVRSNPIRIGLIVPLLAGFVALAMRKTRGSWRWRWGSSDFD